MPDEYLPSYATAVVPVLGWVHSNDWLEAYEAYIGEFYSDVSEAVKIPVNEMLSELPTAFFAKAARACFDDFLTVEYESDPSNALDQYLDECGQDLENADVDFLLAFRTSVVRAYYVVSRSANESVILRDLSGGERAIQIEDEMLTSALSAGDSIATRIVTIDGKDYLAGPVLVLPGEMLEAFKQAFADAVKEQLREVEKYLRKVPAVMRAAREKVLKVAASVVSGLWVANVLAALGDTPPFANEDDPDTEFEAAIAYDGEFEPIVEFLDAHPDLERPIPKEFFWLWHMDRTDPEASLKATVWLSGPDILLESCERSRIEEAAATLSGLLGDAVEEVTIREVGDETERWGDLDEDDDDLDGWLFPEPMPDEGTSAYLSRIYEFMQQRLRSVLDSPVPALNDRIPRQLAATAKGRKKLAKWLTSLEAEIQSNAVGAGIADFDIQWMWKELGMESHRQSSLFE